MSRPAPGWLTEVPFAHRGLHDRAGEVPENSLPAFAAAAEAGYGIELDVHVTADGHVVVTHDDDTARVCGTSVSVAATTLEDLRTLRLTGTDERIPSLAEVLDVVAGRAPIMVEVKNPRGHTGALEPAVAALVAGATGPVCVASFNPLTVGWFAKHHPDVVRGQTSSSLEGVPAPYVVRRLLTSMAANRWTTPDFVSYGLDGLPNPWCERWREAGRPLVTWTVRTPQDLVKARAVADNHIFEHVVL